MHCLADQVLAEHRPQRGAAVATARERRKAPAFELNVAEDAVTVLELAKKIARPSPSSRDKSAKLMPSIAHRDRRRVVR